jgi:C-terminal processing protease CtpA/Prc
MGATKMTNKRFRSLPQLLTLLMCAQLPLAAYANGASELKSEAPSADASQASQVGAQASTMLTGEVHKADSSQDANSLQAETASKGTGAPYALALKKLAARATLTSDDYRSLGIGVLGYEADRTYYKKEGKVTAVYPGLPAAEAGIEVGDKEIFANADDSKVVDPTRPTWAFSSGIAGQPLDITIKHHGQLRNVHLVRMNMEDIPDANLRHTYERLVQKLGASPDATVESTDMPNSISAPGTAKLILRTMFGFGPRS